jgi:hypothetical protein
MADQPAYDVPPTVGSSDSSGFEASTPPEPGAASTPEPDADTSGSAESIPKYRFDEVNEALQEMREQHRMLLQQYMQLATHLGRQAPSEASSEPPLDEREQTIVNQLDRLLRYSTAWRQLQPLLEQAQTLVQLAQQVPLREQQETQYWRAVAYQTHERVLDAVAESMLGQGRKGADLDPDRAAAVRQSFVAYVQRDPQRVARYEAQDPTLIKDFVEWFRGWPTTGRAPVDPRARQAQAEAQRRAESIRRLPTQGPAGQPVASPPPKVNTTDPEAVHDAGWRAFQALVQGSR